MNRNGKLFNVGGRLNYFRKQRGWTLNDLSTHTTFSVSYLSDIENGRSDSSVNTLFILAATFEITVSEFLGEAITALNDDEVELVTVYRNGDWQRLMYIAATKDMQS